MYKYHQEISSKVMRERQDTLASELKDKFPTIKGVEIDVERNSISWEQKCGVYPQELGKFLNK